MAPATLQPLREMSGLLAILDEWNPAAVTLEDARIDRCLDRGAGGAATAEALVADLYDGLGGWIAGTTGLQQIEC